MARCLSPNSTRPRKTPMAKSLKAPSADVFAAVAVMQEGEGWGEKFSPEFRNGDWDFAIFSPKGERLVEKDVNDSRACHQPFAETQHLFSLGHMVN